MSLKPIDLTGGKSVYCFNQHQLDQAQRLYQEESPSGEKIREAVQRLESEYSRNEQATIAFTIIEHLNQTSEF
ncbi:MAG: hypothetical protein PF795_14110 [Kiritimatiellae bacterium]|jgi:hypothetical protein|nr:hypothetical protein [Kiritimatiellia bacterium]